MTEIVSDLVFDVSKLDRSSTERVQCASMSMYRAGDERVVLLDDLLEPTFRTEAKYGTVEKTQKFEEDSEDIFLK